MATNNNSTVDVIKKSIIIFILVSGIIFTSGISYSAISSNSEKIAKIEEEYKEGFKENNIQHCKILVKLGQIEERLNGINDKLDKLNGLASKPK